MSWEAHSRSLARAPVWDTWVGEVFLGAESLRETHCGGVRRVRLGSRAAGPSLCGSELYVHCYLVYSAGRRQHLGPATLLDSARLDGSRLHRRVEMVRGYGYH